MTISKEKEVNFIKRYDSWRAQTQCKIPQIAEELKVPELTVKTTLYFNSVCNNGVSRP
jgi:hypothetical protein